MAALGGLLGVYGSDEEEDEQLEETEHETGQVTLFREDSGGAVDLSHLTGGVARAAEADTAAAAARGSQQPQGPRPGSGGSKQAEEGAEGADVGAGAAAMDVDGQLAPAGGGGEQPPAAAEDPLARLPPEMRQPPEEGCYPDVQARVTNWLGLQRTRGRRINDEIRKSRGYRNPEFFSKMIEHLEIKQYGTSFAKEVFDPSSLPKEDYVEALQAEWAAEEERRKAARAAGQRGVEFHKSASNPSLVQPALKPGLNQPGQMVQPQQPLTAAAIAAQAAAAQQTRMGLSQAGLATAAAVAAAQAMAAQLAAQMAGRR